MATGKAVLYVRVSTDDQLNGSSPETQEADCREYASRQGWQVVGAFSDTGSGADSLSYRMTYGGLGNALKLLREHEADVLLCWRFDRLARDPLDLGFLLRELRDCGARLVSIQPNEGEKSPDDITAIITLVLAGHVGRQERNAITERTQRGLRQRMESGKPLIGSQPLYGYVYATAEGRRLGTLDKVGYVVCPETAAVVKTVYQWAAEGHSLREIARRLNAQGVPTPTQWAVTNGYKQPSTRVAKGWHRQTLSDILSNPAYYGRFVANRRQYIDLNKGTGKAPRVSARWRKEGDPKSVVIDVPALVTQEQWQTVQAAKVRNKAASPRHNADPTATLLRAGFIRCGHCGGAVVAGRHYSSKEKYHIYRCGRAHSAGSGIPTGCDKNFTVRASTVDEAVWSMAKELAQDSERVRRMVNKRRNTGQEALESAQREGAWVASEIAKTQENLAWLKGQLATERRQVIYDSLTEQIIAADDKLTQLEARRKDVDKRTANLDAWVNHYDATLRRIFGANVQPDNTHVTFSDTGKYIAVLFSPSPESLDSLSYADKRAVLDVLGTQVKLYAPTSDEAKALGKPWDVKFNPDKSEIVSLSL